MPYTIRKVRNRNCYTVKNTRTGRTAAKCTSRKKAEGQKRLLLNKEKRR
jgi:hypothetical protein